MNARTLMCLLLYILHGYSKFDLGAMTVDDHTTATCAEAARSSPVSSLVDTEQEPPQAPLKSCVLERSSHSSRVRAPSPAALPMADRINTISVQLAELQRTPDAPHFRRGLASIVQQLGRLALDAMLLLFTDTSALEREIVHLARLMGINPFPEQTSMICNTLILQEDFAATADVQAIVSSLERLIIMLRRF